MRSDERHLSDQELLLAADGELTGKQRREVEWHLESCWTCRTRLREIDETIADFIAARGAATAKMPPAENARALLRARLAELAESTRPGVRQRCMELMFGPSKTLAYSISAVILILSAALLSQSPGDPSRLRRELRATPDPRLTPGATLPLTQRDVCAADTVEAVRMVPASVAHQVFAAYGIAEPQPRSYEVDYLITPALGGADSIRNFWPQPYRGTAWNAHIKDALEDHLRRLVCDGRLDLATAQEEIAHDWIRAYQKYFQTEAPLPQHARFLKDRPWE